MRYLLRTAKERVRGPNLADLVERVVRRTPVGMVDWMEPVVRVERLEDLEVEEQEQTRRQALDRGQGRPESGQRLTRKSGVGSVEVHSVSLTFGFSQFSLPLGC